MDQRESDFLPTRSVSQDLNCDEYSLVKVQDYFRPSIIWN